MSQSLDFCQVKKVPVDGHEVVSYSYGSGNKEVVPVIRPVCSQLKVDQGFKSGRYSHWFCFPVIGLVWGQDSVGRMRALDVVVGQPLSDTSLRL
jgi:hypothetical protein